MDMVYMYHCERALISYLWIKSNKKIPRFHLFLIRKLYTLGTFGCSTFTSSVKKKERDSDCSKRNSYISNGITGAAGTATVATAGSGE